MNLSTLCLQILLSRLGSLVLVQGSSFCGLNFGMDTLYLHRRARNLDTFEPRQDQELPMSFNAIVIIWNCELIFL